MRIISVKVLNENVEVKYEATTLSGKIEVRGIKGPDLPEPGLPKALGSLLPFWMEEMEFEEGRKHETYGISLQYHKESGRLAAAIQGKRYFKIRNGSHSMSSSYREQPHPNNEASNNPMSDEHFDCIREVLKQAKRYVDGHRLQMEAPKSPKKDSQEKLPLTSKTKVIKGGGKKKKKAA